MKLVSRSVVLLSLGVLVCLSIGCGSSQYATPEATFETAKSAVASEDYQAFCGCLTSEVRDEMAAGLVMVGGFMQMAGEMPMEGPDAEKAKDAAKKVKAIMEKHGLTEDSMAEISIDLNVSKEEQKKEMLKLVEPIEDRDAFVAELIPVLLETGEESDPKPIEQDAKLTDLKTEGDTATATVVQTREGKEKKGPIAFKKVDGEWKISDLGH